MKNHLNTCRWGMGVCLLLSTQPVMGKPFNPPSRWASLGCLPPCLYRWNCNKTRLLIQVNWDLKGELWEKRNKLGPKHVMLVAVCICMSVPTTMHKLTFMVWQQIRQPVSSHTPKASRILLAYMLCSVCYRKDFHLLFFRSGYIRLRQTFPFCLQS